MSGRYRQGYCYSLGLLIKKEDKWMGQKQTIRKEQAVVNYYT